MSPQPYAATSPLYGTSKLSIYCTSDKFNANYLTIPKFLTMNIFDSDILLQSRAVKVNTNASKAMDAVWCWSHWIIMLYIWKKVMLNIRQQWYSLVNLNNLQNISELCSPLAQNLYHHMQAFRESFPIVITTLHSYYRPAVMHRRMVQNTTSFLI